MNHEHNAAVCAAKSRIASHEVFAGIQAKKPPKIGDGGSLPPFNEKDLNLALTQRSSYGPVAFNVWHLDLHWSPSRGIVVNRGEVRRWGVKKLGTPCAVFPFPGHRRMLARQHGSKPPRNGKGLVSHGAYRLAVLEDRRGARQRCS